VRGANVRSANGRKMAEMALAIGGRNDPGNVKGTNGKSHFVLGKGDGQASLKTNIQEDMRSGLLTHIMKCSSLSPR
jgi:hypothetical protein